MECLVDEVRSPVGEQPAIELGHGHPVVAAAETDTAVELDVLHLTNQPSLEELSNFMESGFEAPIVAEEKLMRMAFGGLAKEFHFGDAGCHGFLDYRDFVCLKDLNCHWHMVGMTGGDGHHLHFGVLKHLLQAVVGSGISRGFRKVEEAFWRGVCHGDDLVLRGERPQFGDVSEATDAAQAADSDFDDSL